MRKSLNLSDFERQVGAFIIQYAERNVHLLYVVRMLHGPHNRMSAIGGASTWWYLLVFGDLGRALANEFGSTFLQRDFAKLADSYETSTQGDAIFDRDALYDRNLFHKVMVCGNQADTQLWQAKGALERVTRVRVLCTLGLDYW